VKNPPFATAVGWKMDGQISFCAFVHGVALVHWIRSQSQKSNQTHPKAAASHNKHSKSACYWL
jgi:hypothetical protein